MKLLLICLFAVHITFVVCTYRRHGASSRNSVSFLLRKVCVEVTGLKEEVAELKEEVDGLKEENSSLKEDVTELETEVTGRNEEIDGLKEEIDGLKEEIDGLKEENSALNDRVSATEQPGKVIYPYVTNGLSHPYDLDESTFFLRGIGSNISFLFHFSMKFL